MSTTHKPGTIVFADLTTPVSEELHTFYAQVIGWSAEEVHMRDGDGEYADYSMKTPAGDGVTGICSARGVNAEIPPVRVPYFASSDVSNAVTTCLDLGGTVVKEMKSEEGQYYFAILKDPAGTVFAVYQI